jgi:serine/threonine protein kinase
MENLIGQSWGRYKIVAKIGEGGMATVYKAIDLRLERHVAIKIIRRDAFPPRQLDRILRRFEREAKSLANLSHPNIIKVIDYGEFEDSPYLVMEFMSGGTLKTYLGTPIAWQDAAQVLLPILSALQYAHEHNIVHRDIKPSNILMTEAGQPMLTDFGIAKLLEIEETTTLTGTGVGIGTPEYMAPEQWTGEATPQSDVYSVGVVFYEMITGHKPYSGDTPASILLKQATSSLLRPTTFVRNLPEGVEKILLRALAKRGEDRFQSMSEFASALEALVGSSASRPLTAIPRAAVALSATQDAAATISQSEITGSMGTIRQTQTGPQEMPKPEVKKSNHSAPVFSLTILGLVLAIAICAFLWMGWNFMKVRQSALATSQVPQVTLTPNVVIKVVEVTSAQNDPPTQPVSEPPTSTAVPLVAPTSTMPMDPYGIVNIQDAYLYEGPSMGYDFARSYPLAYNDKVQILAVDRTGLWLYVIVPDNTKGWVARGLLDLNVDLSLVPTASYIAPIPSAVPTRRIKRSH